MAATARGAALTEAHRLTQARISAQTVARLLQIWPLLDLNDLDGTFQRWMAAARPLVATQRRLAATAARSYLTEFRATEAPGAPPMAPVPSPAIDPAAVEISLLTQGPVKLKTLVASGRPLAAAAEQASISSALAGTRHAQNGARDLIEAHTAADPAAHGVRRVTSPGCCSFCAMLAARSYHGLSAAAFKAHDNCHCQPETAYSAGPADATRQAREFAALYAEATDGVAGAANQRNAFRRALAAQRAT